MTYIVVTFEGEKARPAFQKECDSIVMMLFVELNTSYYPYSAEGFREYKSLNSVSSGRFVVITLLTCITMLPFVSNGIVLMTYCKYKCLRTLHDKLLMHLAVLNITMLLGVPLYASSILFPREVLTNKFLCLFHISILSGGMLSALFIYLGMAIDRLICIIYPMNHRRIKTRHVTAWCCLSFLIGHVYFLLPVFGWNNWEKHMICSKHVFSHAFRAIGDILIFSVLLTNICVHLVVVHTARQQQNRIALLVRSVRDLHHTFRKSNKAYVTVCITTMLATVCWMPHLVLSIMLHQLDYLDVTVQRTLVEAAYVPVVINSGISPLIFGLRHKHFKCAIKSTFCKHQHHCLH